MNERLQNLRLDVRLYISMRPFSSVFDKRLFCEIIPCVNRLLSSSTSKTKRTVILLRLLCTFRGVSRASDVARPV